MSRDFLPLSLRRLQAGAGYCQPTQALPNRVTMEDAAINVMTDLKRVSAVIVLPGDTINEAHRRMIERGVRLLLVVDANRKVVGLVTATDILGEKPVQAATARRIPREDVRVGEIMVRQEDLEVLELSDVQAAKVGHVVATLKKAGRQHAVVVEPEGEGQERVRGLFSATQIARQLGVSIQTSEIARTFSQIETMLSH